MKWPTTLLIGAPLGRRAKRTEQMETKKQVLADIAWWRALRPQGWGMLGHDYRARATFISPVGREVEIDGELLQAIWAAAHSVCTS